MLQTYQALDAVWVNRLALADDLADVVVPVLRSLPNLGLLRLLVHGQLVDAKLDGQRRGSSWQVLLLLFLQFLWMDLQLNKIN